jgi:hypothetical protein
MPGTERDIAFSQLAVKGLNGKKNVCLFFSTSGNLQITETVPDSITSWVISAFAVKDGTELAVTADPFNVSVHGQRTKHLCANLTKCIYFRAVNWLTILDSYSFKHFFIAILNTCTRKRWNFPSAETI